VRKLDRRTAGMTIPELVVALTLFAVLASVGATGFRTYNRSIMLRRAAGQAATDLKLARSYAIQRRTNVSFVANESYKTYVVRAANGDTVVNRAFDGSGEFMVETMDLQAGGDSVTFDSRGLMRGRSNVKFLVGFQGRGMECDMSSVGRIKVYEMTAGL